MRFEFHKVRTSNTPIHRYVCDLLNTKLPPNPLPHEKHLPRTLDPILTSTLHFAINTHSLPTIILPCVELELVTRQAIIICNFYDMHVHETIESNSLLLLQILCIKTKKKKNPLLHAPSPVEWDARNLFALAAWHLSFMLLPPESRRVAGPQSEPRPIHPVLQIKQSQPIQLRKGQHDKYE